MDRDGDLQDGTVSPETMTWDGFEIVCISIDESAEYDDPRAISRLGILAPSLTMKQIEVAWSIQQRKDDSSYVHVDVDGEPARPTPDRIDGVRFLRVADEPTRDDPLMQLPTCTEYEREERFEAVG